MEAAGGNAVTPDEPTSDLLAGVSRALAVVAHPDDESFALGAVLDRLADAGAETAVLCFTQGELSTLGGAGGELARVRTAEFADAVAVLGVAHAKLLGYSDGGLRQVPLAQLVAHVRRMVGELDPSHLLVFDVGGVTGHPDHVRATEAALAAAGALGLPVLGWALPQDIAARLNTELGTSFTGRPAGDLDQTLTVTRARQQQAIACHRSQSADNPVLRLLRSSRPAETEQPKEHLMDYGITITVQTPFADTVERVRAALKEQGFGVLTEIDVRTTLREKLGEEMEDYVILGACNPPLAHRALDADRRIGLLLPCNVVVRAQGDETIVEALDPQVMVGVTGKAELRPVADEATQRVRAALQAVQP